MLVRARGRYLRRFGANAFVYSIGRVKNLQPTAAETLHPQVDHQSKFGFAFAIIFLLGERRLE
jgi:hypothetical protein